MLIGLGIRDVVLIEALDLAFGPGLTALTGETGAGKSIILGALGLAVGARADGALVRSGAAQASASAVFALAADHPAWACLDEKGLTYARDEDLVLRRSVGVDGRSRAFVNDQPTGVGVLRELGGLLIEIHGQHETVGLLDGRNHGPLLDDFSGLGPLRAECSGAWSAWRAAREQLALLQTAQTGAAAEIEELTARLTELDRLDPGAGEDQVLAQERALLGAAEKTLADVAAAGEPFASDDLVRRLSQSLRALERAGERTAQAGADQEDRAVTRLLAATSAMERALIETTEAGAAIDLAAQALEFEPGRLEAVEERLFALRAMARKLGVGVDDLAVARAQAAERLVTIEAGDEAVAAASAMTDSARDSYLAAAGALSAARRDAGDRLAAAVGAELAPLKLDKARFRVAVTPLAEDRAGPLGADRIEFEIATLPGASFSGLGAIASGGELARVALALKATLAGREDVDQPLMIFDEVDQGVGGAVADAVGQRLARLATHGQVVVVTHSPQVAARADAHWRVTRTGEGERLRAGVDGLGRAAREEEIARMLSGAQITDAARAAARALMHV
ncbi:MAG TPA: DNA repair protein RecN [Caulobacteraceae bacterium]